MGTFNTLAEAFRYPAPGLADVLEANQADNAERQIQNSYAGFLRHISALSIEEWEELYTRTLDLSPAVAPYIGFQMWGEGYQRGSFMALLNHALRMEAVETEGELPDHLIPVLRYLDRAAQPPAELLEVLKPAVFSPMHGGDNSKRYHDFVAEREEERTGELMCADQHMSATQHANQRMPHNVFLPDNYFGDFTLNSS